MNLDVQKLSELGGSELSSIKVDHSHSLSSYSKPIMTEGSDSDTVLHSNEVLHYYELPTNNLQCKSGPLYSSTIAAQSPLTWIITATVLFLSPLFPIITGLISVGSSGFHDSANLLGSPSNIAIMVVYLTCLYGSIVLFLCKTGFNDSGHSLIHSDISSYADHLAFPHKTCFSHPFDQLTYRVKHTHSMFISPRQMRCMSREGTFMIFVLGGNRQSVPLCKYTVQCC